MAATVKDKGSLAMPLAVCEAADMLRTAKQ
ncbi:hypothetical protein DFQ45_11550 [Thiopseudomonas denitrificans]|uniref:Uncharacterized protein n=1 Tax=Thiopseudomonas denitrificans TaxID=1501432 RepID=A0A4R6TSL4_9GAMM|nr:hypothetical protein DFQ45_11550 [Thiopseudomonas denitrificans]